MAWSDKPTKKQLYALKDMMMNLKQRFTESEVDSVISGIKTRKEASDALEEIRGIRCYENYDWWMKDKFEDPTKKPTVYYQKLLDVSEERRLREQIDDKKNLIKNHYNQSLYGIWMSQLKELEERLDKITH